MLPQLPVLLPRLLPRFRPTSLPVSAPPLSLAHRTPRSPSREQLDSLAGPSKLICRLFYAFRQPDRRQPARPASQRRVRWRARLVPSTAFLCTPQRLTSLPLLNGRVVQPVCRNGYQHERPQLHAEHDGGPQRPAADQRPPTEPTGDRPDREQRSYGLVTLLLASGTDTVPFPELRLRPTRSCRRWVRRCAR